MKKIMIAAIVVLSTLIVKAQNWNETGDNHTTGRLGFGITSPTRDIQIRRSISSAGIEVVNTNATGRSLILLGEANTLNKYIYLGYLNASYNSSNAFQPASGVLYSGASNGMRLISSSHISLFSGGFEKINERLRITPSGFIGIGTTNPTKKLEVVTTDSWNSPPFRIGSNDGNEPAVDFRTGTGAFGIAVNNGSVNPFKIYHTATENSIVIGGGGNVGIGTISPAYILDVCGTIRAKEVKVDLLGGCDFVFKSDYKLMDLKELESFVKTNQHLPEIAPEKEMIENGVNMKELQMKLLQKIEELTLYMIEQNKKTNELIEEVQGLKNKNELLNEKIIKLETAE